MKIIPVPGRTIRNPITGREITEPTDVPDDDPFWIRCLAAGDVSVELSKPVKPKGTE